VDLDAATWTVPAERMKLRKPHVVPLSRRVVDVFKSLDRRGDFIFSEVTDLKAMRRLLQKIRGNSDTVHGFRSSFTDWAGDQTNSPKEVVEFALAHAIPNKTEAAYRRYTALGKRRALMEMWAGFCESPKTGATVTQLKRRA
jgi:integrase